MEGTRRILIVGSDHVPEVCARFLTERFETKHAHIEQLHTSDVHWSEFIIVTRSEHRRLIAHRFPSEYLLRRVVSLDIEPAQGDESKVHERLVAHGLIRHA